MARDGEEEGAARDQTRPFKIPAKFQRDPLCKQAANGGAKCKDVGANNICDINPVANPPGGKKSKFKFEPNGSAGFVKETLPQKHAEAAFLATHCAAGTKGGLRDFNCLGPKFGSPSPNKWVQLLGHYVPFILQD